MCVSQRLPGDHSGQAYIPDFVRTGILLVLAADALFMKK